MILKSNPPHLHTYYPKGILIKTLSVKYMKVLINKHHILQLLLSCQLVTFVLGPAGHQNNNNNNKKFKRIAYIQELCNVRQNLGAGLLLKIHHSPRFLRMTCFSEECILVINKELKVPVLGDLYPFNCRVSV